MIIARAIKNLPTTLLGLMDVPSVLKRVMSSVLENFSHSYRYPVIISPRRAKIKPHEINFSPNLDKILPNTNAIKRKKIKSARNINR